MPLSEREQAMQRISAAGLAAHDAQLFLNTHPDNTEALNYFQEQKNTLERLSREYADTYGPITPQQVESTEQWPWIDSPWPWEMED